MKLQGLFQISTSSALALFLCAATARAGSIRIAERPQLGPFSTLQGAVDAALDGESLLVTPGAYSSFTIDGKSVQVIVGGTGSITITGGVVVKNLAPTQYAFLSRLVVQSPSGAGAAALEIVNVGGHVRLHDCSFAGANFVNGTTHAGTGVRVASSVNTVFSGCFIEGGYPGYLAGGPWIDGGIGLDSVSSSVVLYDCTVEGGEGSNESTDRGGNGGDGYVGLNYGLFASGCTFKGGRGGGGDFTGCYPGGVGGDGVVIDSGQVQLLASTSVGGAGGWYLCGPNSAPGQAFVALNGSVINQISGSGRKITAPRVTADDVSIPITVSGQPGDIVYLVLGRKPAWVFKPSFKGVWMIQLPVFSNALAAGTIGADGTLVIPRTFDIPDGSIAARMYWMQALCVDAAGQPNLSGPAQVLSIDTASARTWYVDASAAGGGNGSPAAPFQNLQSAVTNAFHGDTITLADGLYQGSANRAINPNGRSFRIRSAHGSSNCTIDCQGAARALTIDLGEQVTLDGISIVNGAMFGNSGGAIEAKGAQLWLRDCVLSSNGSGAGGAVAISLGTLRLEGCAFVNNQSPNPPTGIGGAISVDRSSLNGRDCVFAYNSAGSKGGAVHVNASTVATPSMTLTHCTFLANHAGSGGAILAMPALAGTTHRIDDCVFAGNSAGTDGGAIMGQASFAITNSTFVSNSAAGRAGALYLLQGTTSTLRNSIAFGNTALQGPQIFLGDGNPPAAQLSVSYSDIEGGQAAVWLSQGVLTWGAGNLDLDPLFNDPDGPDNNPATFDDNDYDLSASSPCIDAADNGALIQDLLDVDGDGIRSELMPLDLLHRPRRVDVITVPDTGAGVAPIVDMGAFERQG